MTMGKRPKISIVMPCRDEERHVGRAIESLLEGAGDDSELIVVDGGSRDKTREIIKEFIAQSASPQQKRANDKAKSSKKERMRDASTGAGGGSRVRMLDNPKGRVSDGLNIGIRAAQGAYIVRADAHCIYPPNYARRCVELLEKMGAANAGGVQVPTAEPSGGESGRGPVVQEGVAVALRHPLGAGDARWRLGRRSGFVDTVYLGAFRRDLFDAVGLYDTRAVTNQDAELNLRILSDGKKVYLDHTLEVKYYPRKSLRKLAFQYFRYGKGRAYTALKHRKLTSWRQAAPPLLFLGLAVSVIAAFWNPLFLLAPAAYGISLAAVAVFSRLPNGGDHREKEKTNAASHHDLEESPAAGNRPVGLRLRLLVAASWAVMHICWAAGFWEGVLWGKRPAKNVEGASIGHENRKQAVKKNP
ncbi:MAG: glycosyltransferase family 2 protein [Candidatus Aminicenantes bacterium]|nr:glycosyltransferase family 2 protein [Candidatus Aminicenantes bacterium]